MYIAFIDESDVYLAGEKCLLYAIYVCSDLDVPASALTWIRTRHSLPEGFELKWTLDTGDRVRNAQIKEDILCQSHSYRDQFLVSITRGRDKRTAFMRSLQQVHLHFSKVGASHFGVIFDKGATTDRRGAEASLLKWKSPPECALFAEADSRLASGICVADAFAGAYAYMVHKQDVQVQPTVEAHPSILIRLDEFFWEIFRRNIPGEVRWDESHHPDQKIAMVQTGYRHTLGHGLVLDPALSEEQVGKLNVLIDLYQGCTL